MQPRTILRDIALGESPRWHAGRLWFCDWIAREIIAVDDHGTREVMVADAPAIPFCIDWMPDGRLLVVAGREARLLRQEEDGRFVTHVDLSDFATTPWNDIVVDGRGNIYVNNSGFEFPGGQFAPGFIVLIKPDRSTSRVADGLAFPNGMAITPDNRTLIVAESYANALTAFDIEPGGTLSNRRVWARVEGSAPDGICLDAEGAVWYADVPNRRCARVREGGDVLETVELDRGGFACMLGGADRRTLYALAAEWTGPDAMGGGKTGVLVAADVLVPGAGRP